MSNLLLDERMLLWVFIPIIYVTMLISIFRYYFNFYNSQSTAKKVIKSKSEHQDYRDRQLVAKCEKLVTRNSLLTR